jgi:threonyl-tRNA synthetase
MAIDGRAVTNVDYPALEKLSEGAVKEKQKFERIMVPKEKLLEMFEVSSTVTRPWKVGSDIGPSV